MKDNSKRICFISSSGGHFEELKCLRNIADKYVSVLITEKEEYDITSFCDKMYLIPKMNRREISSYFTLVHSVFLAKKIFKKYKITHLVTTGAMCSYVFCLVAKMMGIKVVYIESFARTTTPSLTGRLVYPISDLFIIQWKALKKYYPKSIYGGGIF